jgi:hypothetical protein
MIFVVVFTIARLSGWVRGLLLRPPG